MNSHHGVNSKPPKDMNTSKSLTLDEILERFAKAPKYTHDNSIGIALAEARQAIVEAVEGIYGDSDGLREFASTGSNQVVTSGANKRLGLPFGKMQKVRIAFDVDGTLRCNHDDTCREPNKRVVEMFNTMASFKNTEMYVWSGGGADYADTFARRFGLKVSPSNCISKIGAPPMDIAIDDIQDTAIGKINLIVREK